MTATELAVRESRELGVSDALALQRDAPEFFVDVPVNLRELLVELDVPLRRVKNLRQMGRAFEVPHLFPNSHEVAVRAGLPTPISRFTIAHELGHVILARSHPDLASSWSVRESETYANAFASALLIPASESISIPNRFRKIDSPFDLMSLASQIGLGVRTLLQHADEIGGWFAGMERVWLVVRQTANRFTGRDTSLRIVRAFFDRQQVFVPSNKRLATLLSRADWIDLQSRGEQSTGSAIAATVSFRSEVDGRWHRAARAFDGRIARLDLSERDQRPSGLMSLSPSAEERTRES